MISITTNECHHLWYCAHFVTENGAAPLHQTQITTVASLLAFHLSVLLLG